LQPGVDSMAHCTRGIFPNNLAVEVGGRLSYDMVQGFLLLIHVEIAT